MSATANISWDAIAPFFVWQVLIPLAAGWTQSILYAVLIRAGDPKPPPGSTRFNKHRRQILIAIYFAYFAFIVYEIDYNLQRHSHAYNDLGVPIDVNDSGLHSRFRKLTIRFHPDKVRPGVDRERANSYYVHLKHARDIIADPIKRFTYDRFGIEGLQRCPKCLTIKENVDYALTTGMGTYVGLLIFLIGANALGYLTDGAYWRYLAIVAIATYDLHIATRADHPSILTMWINPILRYTNLRPPYLPFQLSSLVHKASISAAQFLGLLIPLYRDDPLNSDKTPEDTDDMRHKQIDRLDAMVRSSNLDLTRLLELESIPFKGEEAAQRELKEALRKYMVLNVIHQEKEVRNAMGHVIARRRADAPHGAHGTK